MTPATAHIACISSLRPSGAPDFAMIPTADEHSRGWDNPMSGSAPWTTDRNSSQVEAHRTMLSETSRCDTFEQLALPLFPSLYNHAFWLTHDQAEAEDLVQETFSKALGAFDSFQPGTNFKAWTIRILRNTFLTTRTGLAASRTVFLEDHPEQLDTPGGSPPEDNLIRLDNLALSTSHSSSFHHNSAKFCTSATLMRLSTKTSPSSSTSP